MGHSEPKRVVGPDCHRWCECRQDDMVCGGFLGTLIRHARPGSTAPVGALAISMIQPSFRALLMTKVRSATLFPAGLSPAPITAVLLPAVTAAANAEENAASFCAAKSLTQSNIR